jgi:hypothetical protein
MALASAGMFGALRDPLVPAMEDGAGDTEAAPLMPALPLTVFDELPAAVALLAIVSLSGNKTLSCAPKQLGNNTLTNSREQHIARDVDEVKDIFCHDLGAFPSQFK